MSVSPVPDRRRRDPRTPGLRPTRSGRTAKRLTKSDLEHALSGVEVNFADLSECVVGEGWRLTLGQMDLPGMHYVLTGHGVMTVEGGQSVPLAPHMLVILPPGRKARVDVPRADAVRRTKRTQQFLEPVGDGDALPRRFVTGGGPLALALLSGSFHARHGRAVDLFAHLAAPIVEAFDATDRLDGVLKAIMAELLRQDLGAGTMTAALTKQVFVQLFRRALVSSERWVDDLSILGDTQISRAYAEMVTRPNAGHTVGALASTAGLSRSVFMARFSALFGRSPMAVLRELRMGQAANLLSTDDYRVEQVAHLVGYTNRSSFCRAFRESHGHNPSAHPRRKG